MASSSQVQSASKLDDALLHKKALRSGLRQKLEQPAQVVEMGPDALAAVLLDMAAIEFGEKNDALGIRIAEAMGLEKPLDGSLIAKWRKPHEREQPSYAQVMALGPEFNRILRKLESKHFGWARQSLLDLVDALEDVAEEMR